MLKKNKQYADGNSEFSWTPRKKFSLDISTRNCGLGTYAFLGIHTVRFTKKDAKDLYLFLKDIFGE
jgi:hypothetical protein